MDRLSRYYYDETRATMEPHSNGDYVSYYDLVERDKKIIDILHNLIASYNYYHLDNGLESPPVIKESEQLLKELKESI